MAGENKKVDANTDSGGPLDTLLLRALLPADPAEQSRETLDLAQVRSAIAAAAKQPHAPQTQPRRKRIPTKRVQPVRANWMWLAGAAALLAGCVTGWLVIPAAGKPNVVKTPQKELPHVS